MNLQRNWAELWQPRQSRSAFTSLGMKADLKCETTDILQSRQKGSAEAQLPIFGNEGRVLVEKPIFRSLAAKIERKCRSETANLWKSRQRWNAEAEPRLWKSWQNKCGKRNFRSLPVKAERKCGSRTSLIWQSRQSGSGTSHFWQSMQNEGTDVELQIFGSRDRAEAEL